MHCFKNPIADFDSSDPFVVFDHQTGYYYALCSGWDRIEIFRNKRITDILRIGESKIIYRPTGARDGIYGDLWAPEMHRGSDGKWYIYSSGRIAESPSSEKRLIILQAETDDPFGEWKFVCKPSPDVYSIDPTVYTAQDGVQYLCCSRVEPAYGQVLDIIKLTSPTVFSNERTMIARAELPWELVPPYVGTRTILEGAFFLENAGRLFIIYSANGTWSDDYALGVLEHTGGALCDAHNWKKHPKPLLVRGNGVYGPGHASFFTAKNGTETWCAYHIMKEHNATDSPATRYMCLQRVFFDETGYPVMGVTAGPDAELTCPAGEQ